MDLDAEGRSSSLPKDQCVRCSLNAERSSPTHPSLDSKGQAPILLSQAQPVLVLAGKALVSNLLLLGPKLPC